MSAAEARSFEQYLPGEVVEDVPSGVIRI